VNKLIAIKLMSLYTVHSTHPARNLPWLHILPVCVLYDWKACKHVLDENDKKTLTNIHGTMPLVLVKHCLTSTNGIK